MRRRHFLRAHAWMARLGIGSQIIVALLVSGLVLALAVEPTRQLVEQRERIDDMTREYRELLATNRALEKRIERLHDPDFIEQRAREQGGLVRPGETAYVVMPKGRKARRKKAARRERRPPTKPPDPAFVDGVLSFMGLR